jgi:hypothetical protein
MKKRDIILDFTSLLDVIMILLFIVMSNTAVASANVSEELTEAKSEISELEYKLQTQSAAEESYAVYSSDAVIVTMYNTEKDGSHILHLFRGENGEDPVEIMLGENSTGNTRTRIRTYITDILETAENSPVYIVFQYDKYTIYRSEFEAIGDELRTLSRQYKEVFYKEVETAGEE